jgi:leader peptidase (prepilin peptidase)/N-methyltransferase
MAAAGAWVGWQGLAAVILYGAGTGLAWALAVAYRSGRLDREMPMAFGPFLGFGLWLTWMLGPLFAAPPWMAP